jgi:hypothetical protein
MICYPIVSIGENAWSSQGNDPEQLKQIIMSQTCAVFAQRKRRCQLARGRLVRPLLVGTGMISYDLPPARSPSPKNPPIKGPRSHATIRAISSADELPPIDSAKRAAFTVMQSRHDIHDGQRVCVSNVGVTTISRLES